MDHRLVHSEVAHGGRLNPRRPRDQGHDDQAHREMTKIFIFSEQDEGREETQRSDGQEPQNLVATVLGRASVHVADRDHGGEQKVSLDPSLLDWEELTQSGPAGGQQRETEKDGRAQRRQDEGKDRHVLALKPHWNSGQRPLVPRHEHHRDDENSREPPQGDQQTRYGDSRRKSPQG